MLVWHAIELELSIVFNFIGIGFMKDILFNGSLNLALLLKSTLAARWWNAIPGGTFSTAGSSLHLLVVVYTLGALPFVGPAVVQTLVCEPIDILNGDSAGRQFIQTQAQYRGCYGFYYCCYCFGERKSSVVTLVGQ
jgi:hypothetical protein